MNTNKLPKGMPLYTVNLPVVPEKYNGRELLYTLQNSDNKRVKNKVETVLLEDGLYKVLYTFYNTRCKSTVLIASNGHNTVRLDETSAVTNGTQSTQEISRCALCCLRHGFDSCNRHTARGCRLFRNDL